MQQPVRMKTGLRKAPHMPWEEPKHFRKEKNSPTPGRTGFCSVLISGDLYIHSKGESRVHREMEEKQEILNIVKSNALL